MHKYMLITSEGAEIPTLHRCLADINARKNMFDPFFTGHGIIMLSDAASEVKALKNFKLFSGWLKQNLFSETVIYRYTE